MWLVQLLRIFCNSTYVIVAWWLVCRSYRRKFVWRGFPTDQSDSHLEKKPYSMRILHCFPHVSKYKYWSNKGTCSQHVQCFCFHLTFSRIISQIENAHFFPLKKKLEICFTKISVEIHTNYRSRECSQELWGPWTSWMTGVVPLPHASPRAQLAPVTLRDSREQAAQLQRAACGGCPPLPSQKQEHPEAGSCYLMNSSHP